MIRRIVTLSLAALLAGPALAGPAEIFADALRHLPRRRTGWAASARR